VTVFITVTKVFSFYPIYEKQGKKPTHPVEAPGVKKQGVLQGDFLLSFPIGKDSSGQAMNKSSTLLLFWPLASMIER
jgi:hypothetical protein